MTDKIPDGSMSTHTADGEDISAQISRIRHENRALFERLIQGEKRFRSLAKAVWMVQEEERRALARELHDGIGQTLTALKNQLERQVLKCEDESLGTGLKDSVGLAKMALDDTRELSRLLRPAVLDDLGLDAAIRWLCRTLSKRADIAIEVDCNLGSGRLDPDIETMIFRVVQESLNNVIKHAGTDQADVDVNAIGPVLNVRITDSGAGFDVDKAVQAAAESKSLGLRGMRDRVELFGGQFSIRSHPGSGCEVELTIPLTESNKTEGASA